MHLDDQLHEATIDGDLTEAVRCLDAGARVDAEDEDGCTPLMSAAYAGNLPLVQELVRRGANVNRWAQGDTPLGRAAAGGRRAVFEYLADLSSDEVYEAVGEEELERGERRRRRGDDGVTDDFAYAAALGELDKVQAAIASGVDVNALGSNGCSALQLASFRAQEAVMRLLLDSGADVNLKCDDHSGPGTVGSTALAVVTHSIYAEDRPATIRLLVEAGADLNTRDDEGSTPLMHAVRYGPGYLDSVQALAAAGADLDARDPRGNTALMMAMVYRRESIVEFLQEAGASLVGIENVLLSQAAERGDQAAVEELLAEGKADVNHRYHTTALSAACRKGYTAVAATLLDAGAEVNLPDVGSGFCPLINAAYYGRLDTVELLLGAGADVTAEVEGVGTALDYAQMRRKTHGPVIKRLKEAGTPSAR